MLKHKSNQANHTEKAKIKRCIEILPMQQLSEK
jgi:hypothetical protein